ncbi:MAG: hypothetical protein U0231_14460 [Nitrospiraceae bacterium]
MDPGPGQSILAARLRTEPAMTPATSTQPMGTLRRLLMVKPSSLGDIVHAMPTVASLRRGFPEARHLVGQAAMGADRGADRRRGRGLRHQQRARDG